MDRASRRAWVIGAVGSGVIGAALAAMIAFAGGDGRVGLIAFLAGATLATAAGALYAVGSAVADHLRDRPVPRSRVFTAAALGVLAAVLPVSLVGLGG